MKCTFHIANMPVYSVHNNKGGTGKTVIALHLAFYLAGAGRRVIVVDLDPQANTSRVLPGRQLAVPASALFTRFVEEAELRIPSGPGLSVVPGDRHELARVVGMDGRAVLTTFAGNIARVADHVDDIVIDTSPGLTTLEKASMAVAHAAVVPSEPHQASIDGVMEVAAACKSISQSFNPGLTGFHIVLNRVSAVAPRQHEFVNTLVKRFGKAVAPVIIGERDAYKVAHERGVAVWDMARTQGNRKAVEDMLLLMRHITGLGQAAA